VPLSTHWQSLRCHVPAQRLSMVRHFHGFFLALPGEWGCSCPGGWVDGAHGPKAEQLNPKPRVRQPTTLET